jgi:catechol 2,3-dioxygenase-like lactoylglutathione lyase family enzyme
LSEANPYIDYGNLPAPSDGILATLFLTVRNIAVSLDFYSRVLGGTVVLEENPRMVRLSNSWIIMNPGGGPTPDTPGIAVVNYEPNDTMSIFLNLRVADVEACDGEWSEKRATFVTPPIDRGSEIRCYMPDPDGHLIELGQASGLLRGALAKKRLAAAPCITVTDEDAEERTHRFGPMPPHPEVPTLSGDNVTTASVSSLSRITPWSSRAANWRTAALSTCSSVVSAWTNRSMVTNRPTSSLPANWALLQGISASAACHVWDTIGALAEG